MKSFWAKHYWLVMRFVLAVVCLVSIVEGFLAFRGQTMNLKLAFYSIQGLLLVIALSVLK